MLGGGLYVSARPGFQPQVGSVAKVSWFSRGLGLDQAQFILRPEWTWLV